GGGDEPAAADHEDIATGAFRHVPVFGEEDGFVEPVAAGVVAGPDLVYIGGRNIGAAGDLVVLGPPTGACRGAQGFLTWVGSSARRSRRRAGLPDWAGSRQTAGR